ncbi:hypothetical protein HZS_3972 [Henneguya salminicola]|nr:hypothetical protein HZS_3972 [Henneguya salminicola]
MEQKIDIMYRRVCEKVRENVEIPCLTAMCDFEKASINSFMFYYPRTPFTGFLFYFSKCIWSRIQSGEQSTLYRDNETARRTKHTKNIYASMGSKNNSENF